MVPYVIRRRQGRFLQIFFPFKKCLYFKTISFSLRGRAWVGGFHVSVEESQGNIYLIEVGDFSFFFFCILMLMRDVGKLYSKRWKQKTLVVNGSRSIRLVD